MLRDAYVRAVVAEHFPTFDRVRQNRLDHQHLDQVTIVLPRPPSIAEYVAADELAVTVILTSLDVKIPLVVQHRADGGAFHTFLPLVSRARFFRIMEGQVLDALNVQRAWPDDLEDWDAERWSRARSEERLAEAIRLTEARRSERGPRHIRHILAPLIDSSGPTAWSAWLRSTALALARQDRGRRH